MSRYELPQLQDIVAELLQEAGFHPLEVLNAATLNGAELMGIDHEKLTYRWSGRDFRLTNVSGNVVKEIIA